MATQARLRANKRYEQQSVKRISVPFYPKDKEIYAWVAQHESMAGYIRELIVKDMQAQNQNEQQ